MPRVKCVWDLSLADPKFCQNVESHFFEDQFNDNLFH